MSYKQYLSIFLIAVFGGLIGGFAMFSMMQHGLNTREIVRAKQFEAVGSDGAVRARFGVKSGDVPTFEFLAPDGRDRLWMMLDGTDQPTIIMRDFKGRIRAFLGRVPADTTNTEEDDWALAFKGTGTDQTMSWIGMKQIYPSRKHRGVVSVTDEAGRSTTIPNR